MYDAGKYVGSVGSVCVVYERENEQENVMYLELERAMCRGCAGREFLGCVYEDGGAKWAECVCVVYRARKCHAPRDAVCDVLRAVLGVNFSVARTKVEAECEAMESVLGVQSSKMRKRASRTLSWGV